MPHTDFVMAVDATGGSDIDAAKEIWQEVVARYARRGVRLARPVSLVIERMPIMGATESTRDGHRLHIAAHAVRSGMLDGLMAHEMGHMVLTERGHPSHRTEVHRRAFDAVPVPSGERRAFGGVAREAVNHVEDIYADDLAVDVIGRDRDLAGFFSNWALNSARAGSSRWATVGNAVTVAFALGNLGRRRIAPETRVWARVEAFADQEGIESLRTFVDAFRDLPVTEDATPIEAAIRDLLATIVHEARSSNLTSNTI